MLFCIAAFVGAIMILIDAFKNEVWKGILGFFCFFYLLYYAIVEYQAQNKWLIVALWLGGGIIGGALMGVGGVGAAMNAAGPLPH